VLGLQVAGLMAVPQIACSAEGATVRTSGPN